jgi:hypothetical protein
MGINLLGEYYKTYDELFDELLSVTPIKYPIFHVSGTKQGVIIEHPIHGVPKTNCNGFYIIYKHDTPIYVGQCSGKNTIHVRISRFVKTLLGNNTEMENHPAATEFMRVHGNSLEGLSVVVFPVDRKEFELIEAEKVETRLIQRFSPRFNKNGKKFKSKNTCYKV